MVFIIDTIKREWGDLTPEDRDDAVKGAIAVFIILVLTPFVMTLIGG